MHPSNRCRLDHEVSATVTSTAELERVSGNGRLNRAGGRTSVPSLMASQENLFDTFRVDAIDAAELSEIAGRYFPSIRGAMNQLKFITPEDGCSLPRPQTDIFDHEIRISVQVHRERMCTGPRNLQSEVPFLVWVGESGTRFAVTPAGADAGTPAPTSPTRSASPVISLE